jgi:16S rRNA (cytidine1402-2'-O)-methyltransferase
MLYVIATPIGNLEDITARALRLLRENNLIIAENPNYSRRLIEHFQLGSGKTFIQFAEHNEQKMLPKIMAELSTQDAILISDAGTPGISDPGFRLIREAIREGIQIVPVPGPNAAATALAASGLPTDKFIFFGFVPKTEIKLLKELGKAKELEASAVFYESPQRISKTVGFIAKAWPEAHLVIARELTKIHEEFIRGSASEVAAELERRTGIKGEITVILSFK